MPVQADGQKQQWEQKPYQSLKKPSKKTQTNKQAYPKIDT